MFLYELITGNVPFQGLAQARIICMITKGQRPEFPRYVSSYASWMNLIRKCWEQNPVDRPPMTEVLDKIHCTFLSEGLQVDEDEYDLYQQMIMNAYRTHSFT